MNVEWEIPFLLTSPAGGISFNTPDSTSGGVYILDPQKCSMKAALRLTKDDIPQAAGSILHRQYRAGIVTTLVGAMMETAEIAACGALLREMWDDLGRVTNALETELMSEEDDVAGRRLAWTPTDYGQDRLLTDVRLESDPTPGLETWTTFGFAIHSPLPYVIDETVTTTHIAVDGTVTINNPGNCPVYPNVKVIGPAGLFTYTNETLGLSIVYDSTLPGAISIPGGGQYGFFGHFANNAYLNGNADNLKAGIDILASDFFPLIPGDNVISVSGDPAIDVIWNAGWRT